MPGRRSYRPIHSTDAITLRGADVNIDTSSNPAVVGALAPLSTTPSATLTGLGQPDALAFDSSGNLYVANDGNNTVSKFAPGSTTRQRHSHRVDRSQRAGLRLQRQPVRDQSESAR